MASASQATSEDPSRNNIATSKPESSGTAPRSLWTAESHCFDPTTMSAVTLDRLQQYMSFQSGPLYYMQAKQRTATLEKLHGIHTEQEQNSFMEIYRRNQSDVTVFFFSHIFEHFSEDRDPRKAGTMRFRVGIPEKVFVWLFRAMEIHPLFIESLAYLIGHFAIFTTMSETVDTAKVVHFLVKVPSAGLLEAAFYVLYDVASRKSLVLVCGNDLNGLAEMLKEHFLTASPPYDPFEVILVLALRYFRFLEAQRRECDHAVIMMERETGRGAVAYSGGDAVSPDKFDLTFMHWIEGNQRNVVFASQYQAKLMSFLLSGYLEFLGYRDGRSVEPKDLKGKERLVYERLKSHEVMVKGLLDMCLVMRERIQRQLGAADSIINQYDNKVSMRNAETSTSIAEQSRRIADESKAIASETRRESTSMKTIAGLTMIYLPSTFAASIFSTGFFSYDISGRELVRVNPQIWKLFIVAIMLSLVTMAIWVWLNKKGLPSAFDWARHSPSSQKTLDSEAGNSADASASTAGQELSTLQNTTQRATPLPKTSLPVRVPEDMA